ncbi:unnamed protein product [Orchesella dallaii]|uniref:Uncharacterized protein n=1 Tax=Orchesella dallaii TaxID=48710 RepID=A0ABP1Q8R7_9HEXA
MKWGQCNSLAVMATVLLFLPENLLASGNSSLFSTALRNRRVYDTSLQSSIIRLIRELMLTPKVYDSMANAEKRADSGRVLFPGQTSSTSQTQHQYRIEEPRPIRAMALTGRNLNTNGGSGSWRPGKVERVPRPIIINGNNAAMNAPRYNRMIEGPAPTVGAIKIPPPSVIMSQPLRVLEGDRDSRGRSLKEIDVQGVRVIVGQRVPDDPEDKIFTWRNGRVIKGMFFPNDPSNNRPALNQEESNDISKPSSLVISSAYNF